MKWAIAMWGWLIVGGVLLAGCTLPEKSADSPGPVRDEIQARLAEARQDRQIALDLWDRLIDGQAVSCTEAIPVPEPLNFSGRDLTDSPQAAQIQAELNAAIQGLRNAADLWNIECADSRAAVPLALAREGRASAWSAGEALNAAQALFDGWPPP